MKSGALVGRTAFIIFHFPFSTFNFYEYFCGVEVIWLLANHVGRVSPDKKC